MRRGRGRRQGGGGDLRLSVAWKQGSVTAKPEGDVVAKDDVQEEPAVMWMNPDLVNKPSMTLAAVDPDAPGGPYLHWLVMNCVEMDPTSGQKLVPWSPPAPPAGSGTHRYVFTLHPQKKEKVQAVAPARENFDLAALLSKYQIEPAAEQVEIKVEAA